SSDTWAVLDYKTSDEPSSPAKTHQKGHALEWVDLQLPLYRHLARAIDTDDRTPLIGPDARIELGYVCLSREPYAEVGLMAEWEERALLIADEKAREMVRLLREGEVQFSDRRPGRSGDRIM